MEIFYNISIQSLTTLNFVKILIGQFLYTLLKFKIITFHSNVIVGAYSSQLTYDLCCFSSYSFTLYPTTYSLIKKSNNNNYN